MSIDPNKKSSQAYNTLNWAGGQLADGIKSTIKGASTVASYVKHFFELGVHDIPSVVDENNADQYRMEQPAIVPKLIALPRNSINSDARFDNFTNLARQQGIIQDLPEMKSQQNQGGGFNPLTESVLREVYEINPRDNQLVLRMDKPSIGPSNPSLESDVQFENFTDLARKQGILPELTLEDKIKQGQGGGFASLTESVLREAYQIDPLKNELVLKNP